MENFLLISPQFPSTYWRFARALKRQGFNVVGIGNAPYYELSLELKENLSEYYYCSDMENYQSLYKAVAFLSFKHGKMDFIESNNEYWLASDAQLRSDFNIDTGPQNNFISNIKEKSKMKVFYQQAGVAVARYILPVAKDDILSFAKKVGFPLFAKPNVGVGATHTFKINSLLDIDIFWENHDFTSSYIIEEFIDGTIVSFDGIVNSHSEPVLMVSHVFPQPNDILVNELTDDFYYTLPFVPSDLEMVGRQVLKAFGIKKRFFHLEFFRLNRDQFIGKQGDIVALEVNMRPAGGYTPDMINISQSLDCYEIYADVMKNDKTTLHLDGEKFYCMECARRKEHIGTYANDDIAIHERYRDELQNSGQYPSVLATGMGDFFYMGRFHTLEEALAFRDFILSRKNQ